MEKPNPLIIPIGCSSDGKTLIRIDMSNHTNDLDDSIAYRGIDYLMPLVIVSCPERCTLYHDPAINKPDEVTVLSAEGKWISVDWWTSEMVHKCRHGIYRSFMTMFDDEAVIKRIHAIENDWTRVRRDLERMFGLVKVNSPVIVKLRSEKPDIVGSKSPVFRDKCAKGEQSAKGEKK